MDMLCKLQGCFKSCDSPLKGGLEWDLAGISFLAHPFVNCIHMSYPNRMWLSCLCLWQEPVCLTEKEWHWSITVVLIYRYIYISSCGFSFYSLIQWVWCLLHLSACYTSDVCMHVLSHFVSVSCFCPYLFHAHWINPSIRIIPPLRKRGFLCLQRNTLHWWVTTSNGFELNKL